MLRDGTGEVGENISLSWLWWIPAVLVGVVIAAYVVGRVVNRLRRPPDRR